MSKATSFLRSLGRACLLHSRFSEMSRQFGSGEARFARTTGVVMKAESGGKSGRSPTIQKSFMIARGLRQDVLVFFVFLFHVTDFLCDGLKGVLVVGVLDLQLW